MRCPAADETHTWLVSTALLAPHAAALGRLSGEESGTPGTRGPGRGFLRVLLGAYLGTHATEVAIQRRCPACGGAHGPPVAGDLRISVSYTDGMVAYALSRSSVGVDIERVRRAFPWRSVAPLVLAPGDREHLRRIRPGDQAAAFLQAWTCREAAGKAAGIGVLDVHSVRAAHPLTVPRPYVAAVARSTRRLRVHVLTEALPHSLDPAFVTQASR